MLLWIVLLSEEVPWLLKNDKATEVSVHSNGFLNQSKGGIGSWSQNYSKVRCRPKMPVSTDSLASEKEQTGR